MAAGNRWKHLEFTLALSILSVKLENIRIGTPLLNVKYSLNILDTQANRYFRARNMLPRNNADVKHCEKNECYFQNKAVYRAEDRPTMTFT